MNFTEGSLADVEAMMLLSWLKTNWEPSTFYYCPPYSCIGLVNVYKFRVHAHAFTKLHDRCIPSSSTLDPARAAVARVHVKTIC